jgi:amino acid permease
MRHEKPFVIVAAILALAFLVLGIIYMTFTATHLPSFVPGHVSRHVRHENHYTKRAAVAFVLAIVFAVLAWSDSNLRRRRRHRVVDASPAGGTTAGGTTPAE